MVSGPEDITRKVYRRAVNEGVGEFSLDGTMLAVLMKLDGKTCAGDLAGKMGLDIGALSSALTRLLNIHLIEPVEPELPILDKEFTDYLREQLSLAVGPIAAFLLEDAVASLGHGMARFPKHLAAELVDLVSREIRREEKRMAFRQNLLRKMKDNGS